MSYKLGQQNQVQHVESGAWIPARFENGQVVALDEHSLFVQDFIAWVAVGNTPTPPPGPSIQDQIAALDAQMSQLELSKVLGRTTREDMLARWVRDYVRVAHPDVNPFTVTSLTEPLALEAFAAFADPKSVYYNPGVGRLKAFDDIFVAQRVARTALQAQL